VFGSGGEGMKRNIGHHLSGNHCTIKDYSETMTAAQWKWHLLNEDCSVFYMGCLYKLVGKSIGFGIVEVKKASKPI